jgi:chemotaxis protein methyltransferase CheR
LLVKLRAQPHSPLDRKVVDAMMTNETMFFRDAGFFDALKKSVLPQIIARRSAEKRLNLWCAACSTGQEPYSIVMLLLEHFPEIRDWTVRFLATDISADVLARAREGRYNQLEVNRGLPVQLLVKYFRKEGTGWVVRENVQKMIDFRELNLTRPWPTLSEMDIVFLRNVLIYFEVETKKTVLGRVRRLLRPDGYLFVGGAETTINLDSSFQPVLFDKTVYYRLQVQ